MTLGTFRFFCGWFLADQESLSGLITNQIKYFCKKSKLCTYTIKKQTTQLHALPKYINLPYSA